jgi:glycosyltransferase involved in cell wall biosynthesis
MFNKNNKIKLPIIFPENDNYYSKEKRYILHILEPEPEGELGGADTHVLNLCKEQKKNSKYAPIVLINQNKSYANMLREAKIAYIDGTILKHKKLDLIRYAKNIPEKLHISCIHSHQYDANYITYLLHKIYKKTWKKIPVLMTCHGWIENTVKNIIKTKLDFFTYNISKALITVCKKDYVRLKKHVKNKEIYCIPNGVCSRTSILLSDQDIKNMFNLPLNAKIITFVGRLSQEKRIDLYLKACKEVSKKCDNVIFVVAGSGSEERRLKGLASALKIKNQTYFLGFVKQIECIYEITDIMVLASDTETTPRTILEAMSFNKCVVATRVGGVSDIIESEKNGILVNKGSYIDISKAIIQLLKNTELRIKIGEKAKNTVNEKFTITIMERNIEKTYDSIINHLYV